MFSVKDKDVTMHEFLDIAANINTSAVYIVDSRLCTGIRRCGCVTVWLWLCVCVCGGVSDADCQADGE